MGVTSFQSASPPSFRCLNKWGKRLTVADKNCSPPSYDLIPDRVYFIIVLTSKANITMIL